MQNLTPFLWLGHEAEEAAWFCAPLLKGSSTTRIARSGGTGPGHSADPGHDEMGPPRRGGGLPAGLIHATHTPNPSLRWRSATCPDLP